MVETMTAEQLRAMLGMEPEPAAAGPAGRALTVCERLGHQDLLVEQRQEPLDRGRAVPVDVYRCARCREFSEVRRSPEAVGLELPGVAWLLAHPPAESARLRQLGLLGWSGGVALVHLVGWLWVATVWFLVVVAPVLVRVTLAVVWIAVQVALGILSIPFAQRPRRKRR